MYSGVENKRNAQFVSALVFQPLNKLRESYLLSPAQNKETTGIKSDTIFAWSRHLSVVHRKDLL